MDIVEKLSRAVSIPTVSHTDRSRNDYPRYEEFLSFLPQAFPRLFETAEVRRIAEYSLLLRVRGKDDTKKPVLFLAHYDVVPAGDEENWKHTPFGGEIAEEAVWGRGTIDNKGTLAAVLQAAEEALETGWKPERTIYFASGHDEEIGGAQGAKNIVADLSARGVQLEAVYDEGMTIVTPELFPMMDRNIAFIGTSEKGHVDIEIIAEGDSGHASMPPGSTAAGIIAKAVAAIERNPFPSRIIGPVEELFRKIAPYNSGFTRLVLNNPRLWGPVLKPILQKSVTSNALIRTTQAVTMLRGSEKENVLPHRATAAVNCRILPGETIEDVIAHIERTTSGIGVRVRTVPELEGNNPLPVSSTDTETYRALDEAVRSAYPDTVVVPTIVLVTTDSRHFSTISENIYRFVPVILDKDLLGSIHSSNERLPIESLTKACRVYRRLLEKL